MGVRRRSPGCRGLACLFVRWDIGVLLLSWTVCTKSDALFRNQPTDRGLCPVRDEDRRMSEKTLASEQDRTDRRVRRTRAALQQALIELLPRKSYEQITVEDICAAADIGRSTFYAHYRGKEDLQRAAIGDRLGNMLA